MASHTRSSPTAPLATFTTLPVATSALGLPNKMVCGGLAGMVAKTTTNPFERLKILRQTGHVQPSILSLYQTILKKEGVLGLWAGNGANCLRIFPHKAIVFSSQDFYLEQLTKATTTRTTNNNKASVLSFISGGLSGATACLITYPLDLARGRIAGQLQPHGIGTTLYHTLCDQGVKGLYRGVTPTVLGAFPYVGIQFGTVHVLERLVVRKNDNPHNKQKNGNVATTPLHKLLFGAVGGLAAGTVMYPNDTVRRLLQVSGSRRSTATQQPLQYRGWWDCVVKTYTQHGVMGFYRGLSVCLIRMAPNTAVQFGCYEYLKTTSLFRPS